MLGLGVASKQIPAVALHMGSHADLPLQHTLNNKHRAYLRHWYLENILMVDRNL